MKLKWKPLVFFLAVPLVVGTLSALLTGSNMADFASLVKPPLSPPGWLFPVVWTILYLMMGLASYLIYTSGAPRSERITALGVYAIQLAVNFFWSIIFFRMELYLFAFFWLILLWLLILDTLILFRRISQPAGWLLLPYLLWVAFAGYLNLGIFLLN